MKEWVVIKLGSVDNKLKQLLEEYLKKDAVVNAGKGLPIVSISSLSLGFVVVSLLSKEDPIGLLWDGLEKLPATWERHVLLYGDYRRVSSDVANLLPLLSVDLYDGGIRIMHFKTREQVAEYISKVIDRRRQRYANR